VAGDQTILMYISPTGDIYVPQPANFYLQWAYTYNEITKSVSYTIKDELWMNILRVDLKIAPFL
jgi:hypothetical protein